MYNLRIAQPGGENRPPGLAFATPAENLEHFKPLPKHVADMAGRLGVRGFILDQESFGFGAIGDITQDSPDEAVITFRMPPENTGDGSQLVETTGSIYVLTNTLNGLHNLDRSKRLAVPPIKIDTDVSGNPLETYGHQLRAEISFGLMKFLAHMGPEELQALARQSKEGMLLFAEHFYPYLTESQLSVTIESEHDMRFHGMGDCELGTSDSGTNRRLLTGYNVDTPVQQIMLLGGLATMAETLLRLSHGSA